MQHVLDIFRWKVIEIPVTCIARKVSALLRLVKLIESRARAPFVSRRGTRRKLFNECQLRTIHSDKWSRRSGPARRGDARRCGTICRAGRRVAPRRAAPRCVARLSRWECWSRRFRYCKSSGGPESVLGASSSLSDVLSDIGHFVKGIEAQFPDARALFAFPSVMPAEFSDTALVNSPSFAPTRKFRLRVRSFVRHPRISYRDAGNFEKTFLPTTTRRNSRRVEGRRTFRNCF